MTLIKLDLEEMNRRKEVALKFHLDFDDAYQYAAAEIYGLTIVSFDKDFDKTDQGRKIPSEILSA